MRNWPAPRPTASCTAPAHRARWSGRAVVLGHETIGIADRNTVSGVVRAKIAIDQLREEGLLPEGASSSSRAPASASRTKRRHHRLSRDASWLGAADAALLSRGNLRAEKGRVRALSLRPDRAYRRPAARCRARARPDYCCSIFCFHAPGRVWLGAVMNRNGRDARMLAKAQQASRGRPKCRFIALNDAFDSSCAAKIVRFRT